jgi:hypothetical protein
MMITAHKNNHAKSIPADRKLNIALDAIRRQETITDISKRYDCSRTTVYKQKDTALVAANKAFEQDNEEVLFYIPVTKSFIEQSVISQRLICEASYRNIMLYIQTMYNYTLSLGTVFNILEAAVDKAILINQSYDLSLIKDSAADELFHWGKPILATVDIPSRFCASLEKAHCRDHVAWGVHLLDLIAQGYAPETTIIDGAKGLIGGHQEVLKSTVLRHDHFHMIKDLMHCARYLTNKEASAVTAALRLYKKANKGRDEEKKQKFNDAWNASLLELDVLEETQKSFKLLSQWLQHDVLQLAGHPPKIRAELYDFIVTEMMAIAIKHPHRIDDIITSLNNQREALLDVANALNMKFEQLATQHKVPIETIWDVCFSARYCIDSVKYHEASCKLESLLGLKYEEIENDVLHILETTHRCSSMIENFNSRLRPYLDERKFMSKKSLGLIQFFLNHKPFVRSKHERLVNKTPAEALTGKAHKPWLEMLGFTPWYKQAA